ncbi:hypothetical protein NL676_020699 [Syzygium grande]|nr:hypothetical protein NL676_020699 [Syzygium grande]
MPPDLAWKIPKEIANLKKRWREWLDLTEAPWMTATPDGSGRRDCDTRQSRKLSDLARTFDEVDHKIRDVRPQTKPNFQIWSHAFRSCDGGSSMAPSLDGEVEMPWMRHRDWQLYQIKMHKENNVIKVMLRKMELTTKTMEAVARLDVAPVATAEGSMEPRKGDSEM